MDGVNEELGLLNERFDFFVELFRVSTRMTAQPIDRDRPAIGQLF
jgi:hypothetical protein